MIKVLIIDDEPLACDLVEEYLQPYEDVEIVGRCHDGFEGLKAISKQHPDLLFLDVQMPKLSGFEMLELVDSPISVIFTTAFDEYAIKAFEASAVDYLLKPFSKDRFTTAMDKFLKQHGDSPEKYKAVVDMQRMVIKDGSRIRIFSFQDVKWLQADDDYVGIFTSEGKFVKKQTLQHYENSLPSEIFVRVHRSYLLNVSHIARIAPYEKHNHIALLRDGSRIPVSKTGYAKLKQQLGI